MSYRILPGILAVIAVAPLLSAQHDLATLEAVKDFKTYWRQTKEIPLRVEAIKTLEGNECVPAAVELVRLLDDQNERIRIAAMSVISTYSGVKTFQSLMNQLRDMKEQTRRALLIEVISRAGIQQLLPLIRDIALNDRRAAAHVKIEIAAAIARLKDATDSNAVLLAFIGDADATVRITAIDAIGQLRIKPLGDSLVPMLHDKVWQVRAAAIRAIGEVRVEKAIDRLIAMMRKEGRFQTDTARALFLITTKDFGVDPDQWTKTITALRGFGWKIPTDAEVAKAKASRQRSDTYYGKKDSKKKTFAKITTTSTRVLFIIDVSGSMEDHVVEKDKFDAGYDDYAKLTIVKSELINTIDALDKNTRFNIVAFATGLQPWKKGIVPANVVTRSAAKSFVKRLKPIGGKESAEMASVGLSSGMAQGRTNTFKALMYPFNIDGDKWQKNVFTGGTNRSVKKAMIDTVFFLSDGRPSTGKYTDTEEILREISRINKVYQIVFHTITIGQGTPKEFLRALAIQNGGEYVHLGN